MTDACRLQSTIMFSYFYSNVSHIACCHDSFHNWLTGARARAEADWLWLWLEWLTGSRFGFVLLHKLILLLTGCLSVNQPSLLLERVSRKKGEWLHNSDLILLLSFLFPHTLYFSFLHNFFFINSFYKTLALHHPLVAVKQVYNRYFTWIDRRLVNF